MLSANSSASYAKFRRAWDLLLGALGVPPSFRFTPGSMRAGGCVAAYEAGIRLDDLLWRMRISSLNTLKHYLQEVAASTSLVDLSEVSRARVSALSSAYRPVVEGAALVARRAWASRPR